MLFRNETDRRVFLRYLGDLKRRFGVVTLAYVQMGNHYHLIVCSLERRLAEAMQHLDGGYATWFNSVHERTGALFQGRYHQRHIDDEISLQRAGFYVHLNPSRAGLVDDPLDYRWSSLPSYGRGRSPFNWLHLELLEGRTGRQYLDLLESAAPEVQRLEVPPDDDGHSYWQDPDPCASAAETAFARSDRAVAAALEASVDEIYIIARGRRNVPRLVGIVHAARTTALPLVAVAERYGLRDVNSIHANVRRLRLLLGQDPNLAARIRTLGLEC